MFALLQAPGCLQVRMDAARQLPEGHSFSIRQGVAPSASLMEQFILMKGVPSNASPRYPFALALFGQLESIAYLGGEGGKLDGNI